MWTRKASKEIKKVLIFFEETEGFMFRRIQEIMSRVWRRRGRPRPIAAALGNAARENVGQCGVKFSWRNHIFRLFQFGCRGHVVAGGKQ